MDGLDGIHKGNGQDSIVFREGIIYAVPGLDMKLKNTMGLKIRVVLRPVPACHWEKNRVVCNDSLGKKSCRVQ
jgi:hypothetical protein